MVDMSQWIELNGLKKIWNSLKNKFRPCSHTNISAATTISWCLGNQDINCCDDDVQQIYICKDCGQIKVISAQVCAECCTETEQDKWNSYINQWVDPTILLPWSVIKFDSLYTTQCTYAELGAKSLGDYVIEKGTLNDWTYYKWNSGLLELWITYYSSSSSFSTGANNRQIVVHNDTDTIPFLEPYNCIATAGLEGHVSSSMMYCRLPNDTGSQHLDCWLYSGGNYTCAYWIKAYVTARWK